MLAFVQMVPLQAPPLTFVQRGFFVLAANVGVSAPLQKTPRT